MADILTDRLKRNRDGTIRDDLVSKMAKGLKRIHEKFPLPEASLRDLLSCIKLIGDNNPIPFHWDTSFYSEAHARVTSLSTSTRFSADRLPEPSLDEGSEDSCSPHEDEKGENGDDDESGDEKKEVDSEGMVIREDILPGQTRLIRLDANKDANEPWGLGL